jgi:hypothetical protein
VNYDEDEDEDDDNDEQVNDNGSESVSAAASDSEEDTSKRSADRSVEAGTTQLTAVQPDETSKDGVLDKNSLNSDVSSDSWQVVPEPPPSAATSSAISTTLEGKKTYQETQFEKAIDADVVSMSELRKLGWNGIPPQYRAQAWKILLGCLPTNQARRQQTLERKRSEYKDAMAQHYNIDDDIRTIQEQETLRQVLVDVPRTQPDVPLFRNDRIRRILSRLLYIWAMRHPASSYVQGINDLATPLVVVFLGDYYDGQDVLDGHVMNHLSEERLDELEADVYWCLTNLLAGIQDHYTSDQPGIQRMVMRIEELVNRIDGDLCRHLRETGIQFLMFSFKWCNCLLLREFQLGCVVRLWDTYISEKDGFEDFHVYVCAAFLCQFSTKLQEMSFDELFGFMQAMPTADWTDTEVEMLLSQAFVLSTLFGGSDAHLTNNNNISQY